MAETGEPVGRRFESYRPSHKHFPLNDTTPATATRRDILRGAAAVVLVAPPAVADATPAPLRLAWQPTLAVNIAVLVAQQAGLFADNGLRVELVPVAGSAALSDIVAAGHADACVGPVLSLMVPLLTGLDGKLTAGVGGGGLRLLAERRTGIRHIEDLGGRSIGVGRLDGSAKLFFSVMMRRKGIDPFRAVTWVELGSASQAEALDSGAVDAVAAPDPAAFALRRSMKLVEIATNISGSYRDRTSEVLLCSGRLLRGNPAAAAALTRAIGGAARSVARDPASAARVGAAIAPALSDADLLRMLGEEAPDQHPTGTALVEDVAAYADELRLIGLLPYELNAGRFARGVCQTVT